MFHGYGVARSDFLAVGLVVRFQVPAFVSSFFNCGNGFVDVVFTCTTNVVGRYVAVVVGCVAAQDVFQIHLGFVQLFFSCSLTFSSEVRTAQRLVGQSADNTFFTVNHDRFAAVRRVFADGDFLGQAEVDRFACTACGNDVLVFACVGNGVAQVHFFRRPIVRNDVQTFADFFAYFIQSVLNRAYGFMFRTVCFGYSKDRSFNRTGSRVDAAIQRFGNRVQLADVNRISICHTFGYVGDFVAAVVQTGRSQGHLVRRTICTDLQTFGSQDAVACDDAFGNHTGSFY